MHRSSRLLSLNRSALVVIDIQEKLVPKIMGYRTVRWNSTRLLKAAKVCQVPTFATEQYPKGLGKTVEDIASLIPPPHEKLSFSVYGCEPLRSHIEANESIDQVVLCGIETHICVLQSALDFVAAGYDTFLAVDAVGARRPEDHSVALQRLSNEGVLLATTEGILFEWCESAEATAFKEIRGLVMQDSPDADRAVGFAAISQKQT